MKKLFLLPVLSLMALFIGTQNVKSQDESIPWLKYMNDPEVDSLLNTLSVKEMVTQSYWVTVVTGTNNNYKEIEDLVLNYGIGGVIFFEGDQDEQLKFIRRLDTITKIPLVVALDAEWGTGMRLEGVEDFPYQMTLGAIQNDSLIYYMGKAVAAQCRAAGVNINLAPVADVNNNPLNPVINYRSMGEDPARVALKTSLYMKGMQDNGVAACAKHFPGHGDTDTDSHRGLPVIEGTRERFDSIEFIPFRYLIKQGVSTVMTGHISVPSLDPTPRLPATFSSKVIKGILRGDMGFKGLILTDAMNMDGATMTFRSGIADAEAYAAGNDIIEFSTDVVKGIEEIHQRVIDGKIPVEEVREKCRRSLALKHWISLNKDLYNKDALSSVPALIRDLYAGAVTLIENNNNIIPVGRLDKVRIATVAVNSRGMTGFQRMVSRYTKADHFFIDPDDSKTSEAVFAKLDDYDIVIGGVTGLEQRPSGSFGVTPALREAVTRIASLKRSVILWFGNPYGIARLNLPVTPSGLLIAYQDNNYTQQVAVQVVFGALGASGRLPVTINDRYRQGYGLKTPGSLRLQFGFPENAGISSLLLNNKVDSIVTAGLDSAAYPGCQVIIARKGIIVYDKCFGFHTFDTTERVQEDDLWDLASVTKVSAATPSLMMLHDRGFFDEDKTLGFYLPWYRFSNKADIVLREMLAHQAGLVAWIPFWKNTLREDGTFKNGVFSGRENRRFALPVSDSLYINRHYVKEIYREIRDSKTGEKKYLYSDLTFILAASIVESLTDTTIDRFAPQNIYRPLGAFDITYNPAERYPLQKIVPTEYDSLFRKQLIRGTVHDEGAAMLGGVSGHAGLFATGNDLIKLMEMYRRGGIYGGTRILSSEVLAEYTRRQFPENDNRRALGFDKPMLPNDTVPPEEIYPCKSASPSSFGHSGFTGTFVWIDPEKELTYVFLSNRVYPTRNNSRLYDMSIRSNILQTAYDAITEQNCY